MRDNLALKIISLVASILLWIYVQAERPSLASNISRTLNAKVVVRNAPENVNLQNVPRRVPVSVVGSAEVVERLKDDEIAAVINLRNINLSEAKAISAPVTLEYPPYARGAVYGQPSPIRIQINPLQQSQYRVQAVYPQDPPAGFTYGRPEISPRTVTITGPEQALRRVDKVVALAEAPEPGVSIDGEFDVSVRDKAGQPVSDVTADPQRVKVRVPLLAEPAAKIVTVSPTIKAHPVYPYIIEEVAVTPPMLKISGRPERLAELFTLKTEPIPVGALTESRTLTVPLVIPPGVEVTEETGRKASEVSVTVTIGRSSEPPAPAANPPAGETKTGEEKTDKP